KNTQQSQELCTQSGPGDPNNHGALTNNPPTNTWTYSVDLAPGIAPLSTSSVVNLRAQFLNADGSNAGILSPGGAVLTTPPTTPAPPPTPEPGSLVLLGTGLTAVAIGVRRRVSSRKGS